MTISDRDDTLLATSDVEPFGAIEVPECAAEITCAAQMRQHGLVHDTEPLGYHDWDGVGQVLLSIASDLRVDELLCMVLVMGLSSAFRRREARIDDMGTLRIRAVSLEFPDETDAARRVQLIGRAYGALQRRIDRAGYLRRTGAGWFGNVIVSGAGTLEPTDFDDTSLPATTRYSTRLVDRQTWHWRVHQATNVSILDRAHTVFSYAGALFAEAAERGYSASGPAPNPLPIADWIGEWLEFATEYGPLLPSGLLR